MIVEVTQYMRPDGRKRRHQLEVRDECASKYQDILDSGCRLAAEQLITKEVSQTIECDDFDFAITITDGKSFEGNKAALEAMILDFDKACFEQMKKEYNTDLPGQ